MSILSKPIDRPRFLTRAGATGTVDELRDSNGKLLSALKEEGSIINSEVERILKGEKG
mgnify:CR=1 FL=1